MLLTDILEKNAKEYPHRIALVMQVGYRTVSLSYRDVYNLSLKVACFLEENGIERGDKVLLLAPNSPYWICIFWGSLLRGSILVPLNIQSTGEMVRKIAEQTGAKIIFTHQAYREKLPTGLKRYDIEFFKELVAEIDPPQFKKIKAGENDVIEIMYTSGTTGDPKGVELTHRNLFTNVEAVTETAFRTLPIGRLSPGIIRYRLLSILPLSHIFEQVAGFLVPFTNAAQIVYAHSPGAIGDLLKKYHINILIAVPEFLRILMDRIEMRIEKKGKKKFFDKLLRLSQALKFKLIQRLLFYPVHKEFGGRLCVIISGGAPLDLELERKWSALGMYIFQGYGLTETSPIISSATYKRTRMGSVGKTLPGVEVKIADDGEILVKGPNVFRGYFKDKGKTKEVFTDEGWFKTGDIGEFDRDGFLYIKGRKKYIIKGPGAQNVFPEDIEAELNKISGVKDSSVVGLEELSGQVRIHAVLLLDLEKVKKLSPEQFAEKATEEANRKLASYQRIADWSIWPEEDFPRSATRKVKKGDVLKWLKDRQEKLFIKKVSKEKKITPLMRLLSEVTGTDVGKITPSSKVVREFNIDSLLRVEIVSRIKEKFGVAIDEQKIDLATTVSDFETMITKREPVAKKQFLARWPRSLFISVIRNFMQTVVLFPFLRIFVGLRVEGKEHLKNLSLPAVFMPNHISYLDPEVVAMALPFAIRKRTTFAAAADFLYGTHRLLAWPADLFFNTFPFPRREGERIALGFDFMGRLLDENWSVVIFPEGRVSENGKLLPLKSGTGLVAIEMNSYIVPVKVTGTNRILPYGKFIPRRRGMVTVKFGKPIKFSRADSYIQATEKIQKIMQ